MGVDLNQIIEQVGKEKGIARETIVDAMESALLTAARKKFGLRRTLESQYNPEVGEIELFEFKTVVDRIIDPDTEIMLDEALRQDPDVQVGDSLGFKVDTAQFGRIAAYTAKQIIMQKVREAEREIIYEEYKDRKGETISGIVRRFEQRDLIIDLGRTEAVLPEKEQVKREKYRVGDRIQAYVLDVLKISKGPQIVLSRINTNFLIKLFEMEVPEIHEGIVGIVGAARDPGRRAKIAVYSEDMDVDPVGACVGIKGSRVQNVVQELRGEKIDIVPYSPDAAKFICNAISPAEVQKVIIDNANHSIQLVVADDQLSLAIGKRGQNVRLASQLTRWKIDIQSETKIKEKAEEMKRLLRVAEQLDEATINLVVKHGYIDPQDFMDAELEDLSEMLGVTTDTIQVIKNSMGKQLEARAAELAAAALLQADGANAPEAVNAGDAE